LLVEEISTAAGEQSSGIGQISTAVNEMDKVTQTNAANAEESSAAAEELDTLSDQLQDTVVVLQQMIGGQKFSVAQPAVRKAAAPVVPESKRITTGERTRSVEEIIPLDEGDMDDFKDFGTATA
jgi:methyl-accepting chemotaxis protein